MKTKNNLKVFDDNLPLTNLPYNKKFTRGSDRVRNFDYVLLSPGINYRKCLLSNEIIKNKEKIISDLDVFYKSFPENFLSQSQEQMENQQLANFYIKFLSLKEFIQN